MKRLRVLVLFGGKSAEHEISLLSAAVVLRHLDPRRYEAVPVFIDRKGRWLLQDARRLISDGKVVPSAKAGSEVVAAAERGLAAVSGSRGPGPVDVVFPVLHGPYGEDGTVQGLLEMADLPYVGCGVLSSSVGMDKDFSLRLADQAGVPILPYFCLSRAAWKGSPSKAHERARKLRLPVFVKPARLGSSVGVSKVEAAKDLARALEVAFLYDDKVLVEKGIPAREIECAVLGDSDSAEVSVPGEVITSPKHSFYSYQAKYLDPEGASLKIPAQLTKKQAETVRALAARAFKALDCQGLARVDFLMHRSTGRFYFGEVNTMPGFTEHSLYHQLWKASGLPLTKLLDRLIVLALERTRRRKNLRLEP